MSLKNCFGHLALLTIASSFAVACSAQTEGPQENVGAATSALGERSLVRGLGGLCLDVQNGSTAWQTPNQTWGCNATAAQQWHVTPRGEIRGIADLCLDVHNGSTEWGTPVQTYPCTGGAAQQWEVQADGSIRGLGGLCLDVRNGSTTWGTAVQMYPCTGNAAQKWSFEALSRCVEHELGGFRSKYLAMGGESSWLGCALGDASLAADGSWAVGFEHGLIYQRAGGIPVAMEQRLYNAWRGAYTSTGWPSGDSYMLGAGGWATRMTEGEASIIWSPRGGAQVVRGGVGEAYWRSGGASGSLGFPIENEHDPESRKAYQNFEHGTLCWKSYWSFGWREDTMVASTPAGCWASSGGGGGGGGTPQCTAGTTAPFGCAYGQTCSVFGSVAVCSACGGEGEICCPSSLGLACRSPADICLGGTPTATTGAGTCTYHLP